MANDCTDTPINPDLQALHGHLITAVAKLANAIGDAPDADAVDAIVTEISELNHRVTLTGNLLFTQQTSKITLAVQKVTEVMPELKEDLAAISSATDVIKTVTAFLVVVDKAIDTAKLLAAA